MAVLDSGIRASEGSRCDPEGEHGEATCDRHADPDLRVAPVTVEQRPGGIDVVDRKDDPYWFLGQACVGPTAFVVDRVHQSMKVPDPASRTGKRAPNPDENPKYEKSLGKVNEIGALYATLAGLLNLIAVIDAAWHKPRKATDVKRQT